MCKEFIWLTLLFSFLYLLPSCKEDKTVKGKMYIENFSSFYQKFHTDSSFQMERIVFPLPGINTDDMTVEDTIYYWHAIEWEMHKPLNLDGTDFKVETRESEKEVIEKLYMDDSGFIIERKFELIDGRWFLTFFSNVNL